MISANRFSCYPPPEMYIHFGIVSDDITIIIRGESLLAFNSWLLPVELAIKFAAVFNKILGVANCSLEIWIRFEFSVRIDDRLTKCPPRV